MKKLLFAAALMVAMTVASCGNRTDAGAASDTVAVDTIDTVLVDTVLVDSIAIDSIN